MNATPVYRLWLKPFTKHIKIRAIIGVAATLFSLTQTGHAASATFSSSAPTLGPNDVSNLTGHVTSGSTANQQKSNVGGAANNTTYLADDQMIQGQTFKTGSNTNGYQLTAITLRQVTYSTFSLIPDINYTIRITSPAGSTSLTVLAQETAFVPADALGNFPTIAGGNNAGAGSGSFVTFTLDSPVVLNPNTTYGFDVGGGSVRHYWETDGRSCTPSGPNCNALDPYVNGTAYSSGANGSGTTTMTNRTGDRVFVVALTPANVVIPPKITIQPLSAAYYAGRTAQFSAKASGSPTLVYRWRKNGSPMSDGGNISGALTDSLTISNVSAGDVGAYTLLVTNSANSTSSAPATLSVVASPTPGTNYAYAVFTNNALAHWRLNESGDPSTNPPAFDYVGGRVGTYEVASQNGFNAIAGPRPGAFPGFESTNNAAQSTADTDQSWVTVPALNVNTNTVTFTAWIHPNGPQPEDVGLFWTRSGGTTAGMGYGGSSGGNAGQLNYTWNNGTTWSFVSGLVIPSDQWSFVAVVIEPTKATLYLGSSGVLTNSINLIPHISEAWAGAARIGNDPNSPTRTFNGVIDEVAVFKRSLSFDDINHLYGIGRGVVQALPPVIGTQPGSRALYAGGTARFKASVTGSSPLVYRWRKNGTPLADGGNISGVLTDSLTISNVTAGDAGSYTLVVTNAAGAVTSAPPSLLTLVSPSGKAYESAVRTAHPVAYWRLNETGDPASGTLPAFDFVGGLNGTYGPVAQPGVAGLQPLDFPELETTNTAVQTTAAGVTPSWVTLPALNLNTNTVTFTAWIFPNVAHGDYNGLLTTRNGSTEAAGFHFTSDNQIGYTWNGGSAETYGFLSELRPPLTQWSFVALVIDPSNAALYLFNTNSLSTTNNAIPHTVEAWDGTAQLGGDQETPQWRIFDGSIDELAIFNYAFTPAQVLALYNSAFQPSAPPVTLNIQRVGANVQLTWPSGTLLEANEITGPYTTNNATSPYLFTPAGSRKFFRVKVQ